MEKLVLIDGNSLLNRAFYATPLFTTKDGMPTNGVFGFIKLLLKILSDKKPSYLVVAFDVHKPTFRHEMYVDYKAGRKGMPEELVVQVPVLKDVLKLMGIKTYELAGYEADDVIRTIAKKFDVQTYIYTGDRDAYQLVDETTSVCYTRKGVSDIYELNAENFFAETGLNPSQIIDLKALMGDKSDNIPGVAGVGEKSANQLLEKYGSIDNVYAHIDEIGGALQKKLIDGKENAYFSYKLATINTKSPVELSLGECLVKSTFPAALRNKFAELEFKSLLALDIYEEEGATAPVSALIEPIVTEETIANVQDALKIIENNQTGYIACRLTDREFRFFYENKGDGRSAVTTQTEYVCPVKTGLLDIGFYEYQLYPVLRAVFEGKKRVISYYSKELRRRIEKMDLAFLAPFEDVSVMKCLADGIANTDSLDFCINYFSLPVEHLAYGVYRLWQIYDEKLSKEERWLYENVELPLSKILYEMEEEGICVDEKALKNLSEHYAAEIQTVTQEIYRLAGETFNVNSTQQLSRILFEKLRIGENATKAKNTRAYKTTAEELEKYANEHEIIPLILRYRQIQKLYSTYLEGFKPLIKNGKVHTTYSQIKTETGRLSSANPNIQNIPVRTGEGRELRKLFIASEGNVFIDADYSQIELRLLAHFSGCKELIDSYCKGIDIHTLTASQVFNTPIDEVTSDMRRNAKAVNFGIIYGISAFGLSKDLGISTKKAQEYIDKYFENYSDVKKYMTEQVEVAKEQGEVKTLFGRRRVLHELKSSNFNVRSFGERAAMNMPLQGTSADIIKIAMINISKRLKEGEYKAKLVLQVHDELIVDCPESEQDDVSKIVKTEMENAVSLRVPLTVELNIGKSWFDTK